MDKPEKQSDGTFLHERSAITTIMDCRTVEARNFKRRLGFNLLDVIKSKQQTVLRSIKDAFQGENMQTEYYQSGYRIDLYFHGHRLAIEIDEFGHCDRNSDYEKERA